MRQLSVFIYKDSNQNIQWADACSVSQSDTGELPPRRAPCRLHPADSTRTQDFLGSLFPKLEMGCHAPCRVTLRDLSAEQIPPLPGRHWVLAQLWPCSGHCKVRRCDPCPGFPGLCVTGLASCAAVICCKHAPWVLLPLQSELQNPNADSKPRGSLTQPGRSDDLQGHEHGTGPLL